MLKVYGPSICKPLEMIFNQQIETRVFLSEGKWENCFYLQKRGQKKLEKLPSSVAATYLRENS